LTGALVFSWVTVRADQESRASYSFPFLPDPCSHPISRPGHARGAISEPRERSYVYLDEEREPYLNKREDAFLDKREEPFVAILGTETMFSVLTDVVMCKLRLTIID
jgi:hypothetical protein